MKKPKISFRVFDGSGPLSVYFYLGPYGDAVEADTGSGVGWFSSSSRDLLAAEFDDVSEDADHQVLKFKGGWEVEVNVRKGLASAKVHHVVKKQKSA